MLERYVIVWCLPNSDTPPEIFYYPDGTAEWFETYEEAIALRDRMNSSEYKRPYIQYEIWELRPCA